MHLYLILGLVVLLSACSPSGPDAREHGTFLHTAYHAYASANPGLFGTDLKAQIDRYDHDADCGVDTEPIDLVLPSNGCDDIFVALESDSRVEGNGSSTVSSYRSYSFASESAAESFAQALARAVELLDDETYVELSPGSVYVDGLYRTFEDVRVFRIVDFDDESALYRFVLVWRYEHIVMLHAVASQENRIVVAHSI